MIPSKTGLSQRLPLVLILLAVAGIAAADAPPVSDSPPAAAVDPHPAPKGVETDDLRSVYAAMGDADVTALFELYKSKDPIVHGFAAMAIERTRFNLDAATKDAKVCENSLFETRPGVALSCGIFQVGNLNLAGKRKAASELQADLIRRYRSHVPDQMISNMQADLDRDENIAGLIFEPAPSDVVLPIRLEYSVPIFPAKANGRDFDLMLDTGATGLVLGESNARDLGVRPLEEKGKTNGMLAKDVPMQRGVLDALQIGAITLRNVPVSIVPHKFALIGADLLAPLGALRLTNKELTIYAEHSEVPSCERPMQIATGPWGRWLRILPEFIVNDQPHRVLLDTGAGVFLIGTQAALEQVTKLHSGRLAMNDIGGYHSHASATAAKVNMTIDRQPFKVFFLIYNDSEMKHDITLGSGALKDMDIVLDFRHQNLCFPMHPDLH